MSWQLDLEVSDIVQLKCGGPKMVVFRINEELNTIRCNYFNEKGNLKTCTFSKEERDNGVILKISG
jgi:uncharacterized protein YodC (DUF2158 family)